MSDVQGSFGFLTTNEFRTRRTYHCPSWDNVSNYQGYRLPAGAPWSYAVVIAKNNWFHLLLLGFRDTPAYAFYSNKAVACPGSGAARSGAFTSCAAPLFHAALSTHHPLQRRLKSARCFAVSRAAVSRAPPLQALQRNPSAMCTPLHMHYCPCMLRSTGLVWRDSQARQLSQLR